MDNTRKSIRQPSYTFKQGVQANAFVAKRRVVSRAATLCKVKYAPLLEVKLSEVLSSKSPRQKTYSEAPVAMSSYVSSWRSPRTIEKPVV